MFRIMLIVIFVVQLASSSGATEPVPEKLVVLTFDDSVKSHFTVVRPILQKYGFGATFFITEGFDFPTNKNEYMTWEQIKQLHVDGFEIGNHTRDHMAVTEESMPKLEEQLEGINRQCEVNGIPTPTSFAYPGNSLHPEALTRLRELGIRFARRGGAPEHPYEQGRGFAYQPGLDHPLLIPSAGDARPDWEMEDFVRSVKQAQQGRVAVLQFHGVPDNAHSWVHTSPEKFNLYMNYLATNGYQVIAMRDLAKYVDPEIMPTRAGDVIKDRKQSMAKGRSRDNFRQLPSGDARRAWLENMAVFHQFTSEEIGAATGMTTEEVDVELEKYDLNDRQFPKQKPSDALTVLPYPGGRHPRIGYLDGAIRPQRDTKFSVFTPWNNGSYVVVDLPEAIWWDHGEDLALLYLAHIHPSAPKVWFQAEAMLDPQEWVRHEDGSFEVSRSLSNQVSFGAKVQPGRDGVRMEIWLTNGSPSKLTGLRLQNCAMLRGAPEFAALAKDNKIFHAPYAACRNAEGTRWVITAWENCRKAWGNDLCPCLHSDPTFADCKPGETQRLQGWFSFYEGTDIEAELKRIEATDWRSSK